MNGSELIVVIFTLHCSHEERKKAGVLRLIIVSFGAGGCSGRPHGGNGGTSSCMASQAAEREEKTSAKVIRTVHEVRLFCK